jgi:hypothetical protein
LIIPDPTHEMKTDAILSVTGPVFDVFSYHTYGAVSSRCASIGPDAITAQSEALSQSWLSRGDQSEQFYAALRDRFEPGKPMWLTETAQAACGGDRRASTFLDTFRYLNQLGDLAHRGVQVHMHNTLAASDYGLLDEKTYEPRPNYWAALLWRKLMRTTVLDPGSSVVRVLHRQGDELAHCLADSLPRIFDLIELPVQLERELFIKVNAELLHQTIFIREAAVHRHL